MMHDPTVARLASLRDARTAWLRQRAMATQVATPAAQAFWRRQAAATEAQIDEMLDDLNRLRELYPVAT